MTLPPKAQPKKNLSALKRVRQAEKLNERNKAERTKIRTFRKKVLSAVEAKDKEAIAASLRGFVKVISSAVSKGIVHKNTASRNISRLSKLANSALKPAAA